MSSETLILISGAVLSLLFSYVPSLNTWFAAKSPDIKRLIMAGMLLLVSVAVFGLSCAGLGGEIGIQLECSKEGVIGLVKTFILAIVANQGAYALTPQPQAVKNLQ